MAKSFGYENWNILSAKIETTGPRAIEASPVAKTLYCSFCAKSQHEVQKLIAGPSVYICDACVELCVDIARDGVLWKILSLFRASVEDKSGAHQAALEHVRSKSTEEVASCVEQSKVGVQHCRHTLHLIGRRLAMRDGEVPQEDDALASRHFEHLNRKSKEELAVLQKKCAKRIDVQ